MNCPVCKLELKISERQGIEIDYCPSCRGVWLDRGELDKLIERDRQREQQHQPSSDDRFYPPRSGGDKRYDSGRPRKSFWSELFD